VAVSLICDGRALQPVGAPLALRPPSGLGGTSYLLQARMHAVAPRRQIFLQVARHAERAQEIGEARHAMAVDQDIVGLEIAVSAPVQSLEPGTQARDLADEQGPQLGVMLASA